MTGNSEWNFNTLKESPLMKFDFVKLRTKGSRALRDEDARNGKTRGADCGGKIQKRLDNGNTEALHYLIFGKNSAEKFSMWRLRWLTTVIGYAMLDELRFEKLKSAANGSAAFRCRNRLQPASGKSGKVFPSTYAGAIYAVEKRKIPQRNEPALCVLLDSVQSQANRLEKVLEMSSKK